MIVNIRSKLFAESDEQSKKYCLKVVPGVDKIIGIKMGKVRQIFKQYIKPMDRDELGKFVSHPVDYLEEFLLQGMATAHLLKEYDDWSKIDDFVQKINNWAVCDTFCVDLKFSKTDKTKMWNFLQKYYQSDKEYEIRFAYVMFLNYFLEEKYLPDLLAIVDNFSHPGYYAKMSVAWLLAEIYLIFPNESIAYFANSKLDDDTYKKAIRKILESRKCKSKEDVKKMSRSNISIDDRYK